MSLLSNKKCIPCSGEMPPLKIDEINKYLSQIKNWNVKKNEKGNFFIEKKIKFKNFEESLKYINQVGQVAETENHHPDLKFGWGYVDIVIFTHAVSGLTESDFVLAAKIDALSA